MNLLEHKPISQITNQFALHGLFIFISLSYFTHTHTHTHTHYLKKTFDKYSHKKKLLKFLVTSVHFL